MKKYYYAAMIGIVLGTLAGVSSAQEETPKFRLPGGCVIITEFREDGTIILHKSCEYTEAQKDRMMREGK